MALSRTRRQNQTIDYWPGFVDALSTLLLAIMFLLSVFVLAQFLLSQEVINKDSVLSKLNNQISQLTQLLSLERNNKQNMEDMIANLQSSLSQTESERSHLQTLLNEGHGISTEAQTRIGQLSNTLENEKQISAHALSQVELLNQQIGALRRQIAALEEALNASETRDKQSNAKIADLGKRLNVALVQRVQELNRYRSDFFGRLRTILSDRENIRIVGDRFVFQSEVLFPTGSEEINPAGQKEMKKVANAIVDLIKEIPDDINWVLRVDGHTDNVPLVGTGRLRDNWELSSARATAVVKLLIANGVPSDRLVAAGFGEFQPLDSADTQEARAGNRRIELKLTER